MLDSEIESTQAILNESHSQLVGHFHKKVSSDRMWTMLGVRTVYTALGTWNRNSATATCSRMLFIWPSVPVEGYIHITEYWMVIVEIRPQKHDGSLLPAISCNICVCPPSNTVRGYLLYRKWPRSSE